MSDQDLSQQVADMTQNIANLLENKRKAELQRTMDSLTLAWYSYRAETINPSESNKDLPSG